MMSIISQKTVQPDDIDISWTVSYISISILAISSCLTSSCPVVTVTGNIICNMSRKTEHIIMNNTYKQETLLSLPSRHHFKGYACIKILIATRLTGFKGLMKYKAGVALKRKIVFPLFSTINVCGERERGRGG